MSHSKWTGSLCAVQSAWPGPTSWHKSLQPSSVYILFLLSIRLITSYISLPASGFHSFCLSLPRMIQWINCTYDTVSGFPGSSAVKKLPRFEFDPWVEEDPCRKKCQPTQYSGLGNPWTEGPVSLQSMGCRKLDTTERLGKHTQTWCWVCGFAPGSFSLIPAKAVTTSAITFSMIFHKF